MPEKPDSYIRNQEIDDLLGDIGCIVNHQLPADYGFALLVFPFEDSTDEPAMFYISSAKRTDMIQAMRELLGNLEREERPA